MNAPEHVFDENLNKIENNQEFDIKDNIEKYGILISKSLDDVNNKPLIECLDRILSTFKEYLVLISKVNI